MSGALMSSPGRAARVSDFTRIGVPFYYEKKGGSIMPELMTDIMQVIGSLGFPIVMCILLYNHLKEVQKDHKDEISKLSEVITDLKVTLAGIQSWIERNHDA